MWQGKVTISLFDLKGNKLMHPPGLVKMIRLSAELPHGLLPLLLAVAVEDTSLLPIQSLNGTTKASSSSFASLVTEAKQGKVEPSSCLPKTGSSRFASAIAMAVGMPFFLLGAFGAFWTLLMGLSRPENSIGERAKGGDSLPPS